MDNEIPALLTMMNCTKNLIGIFKKIYTSSIERASLRFSIALSIIHIS